MNLVHVLLATVVVTISTPGLVTADVPGASLEPACAANGEASSGAAEATEANAGQMSETSIAAGDTIEVRVFPDEIGGAVSGRFIVTSDGQVTLSALGPLRIAGLTLTQARAGIGKLLCRTMSVTGLVTVSIAEYAPVFMVGEVARKGPVPYRPGMTVLDLLLAAGGLEPTDGKDAEGIKDKLADLESSEPSLEARRARLMAEVVGEASFSIPSGIDPRIRNLWETERSIFDLKAMRLKSVLQSLREQTATLDGEVALLGDRIRVSQSEISLLKEIVATQDSLVDKGVVVRTRLDQVELDLIRAEGSELELRTELTRAQRQLAVIAQDIRDSESRKSLDDSIELRDTNLEIARAKARIATLKGFLTMGAAALSAPGEASGPAPSFTLYHSAAGKIEPGQPVDQTASLRRGDVVRVSFPSSPVAAGAPMFDPRLVAPSLTSSE